MRAYLLSISYSLPALGEGKDFATKQDRVTGRHFKAAGADDMPFTNLGISCYIRTKLMLYCLITVDGFCLDM